MHGVGFRGSLRGTQLGLDGSPADHASRSPYPRTTVWVSPRQITAKGRGGEVEAQQIGVVVGMNSNDSLTIVPHAFESSVIVTTSGSPSETLKPHPLLNVLPPLDPEEIQCATERVALYGQREPIEVFDGFLVVGLAEYLGCLEAEVEPTITYIEAPSCFVEYVVRRNVPRHLSPLDRAVIAVLAQEQYKKLAHERKREGGRLGAAKSGKGSGDLVPIPFEGERWFESAAKTVGTSSSAVKRMAKIRKDAPDVFDAVRTRKIKKLQDAHALAVGLPDVESRAEVLEKYNASKATVPMKKLVWNAKRKEVPAIDGTESGDRWAVYSGPMLEEGARVQDKSIDAMYADIVYGDIGMAREVGQLALRVLRSGGILVLVNGQKGSMEILVALAELGLTLVAVGAGHMPDSQIAVLGRVERVDSIPVWFFIRTGDSLGKRIRHLHFSSTCEKDLHPWQKSESEMLDILESVADPGARILDPCCGSGTTGAAALKLGMTFIGIDRDPDAMAISRNRLARVDQEIGADELTKVLAATRSAAESSAAVEQDDEPGEVLDRPTGSDDVSLGEEPEPIECAAAAVPDAPVAEGEPPPEVLAPAASSAASPKSKKKPHTWRDDLCEYLKATGLPDLTTSETKDGKGWRVDVQEKGRLLFCVRHDWRWSGHGYMGHIRDSRTSRHSYSDKNLRKWRAEKTQSLRDAIELMKKRMQFEHDAASAAE